MESRVTERPAALAAIPEERVVELDVREDLRSGREPFSRIMAAKGEVPEDGALRLRAIFEPAPLYGVLGRQGFEHWTERRADDDWVVWFWRAAPADPGAAPRSPGRSTDPSADVGEADSGGGAADAAAPEEGVVVLDVRGLEPPEPMVRTLAALREMPRDHTLVQINVREPRFLFPRLEEAGYAYEVRRQGEDLVRVFIRHADTGE